MHTRTALAAALGAAALAGAGVSAGTYAALDDDAPAVARSANTTAIPAARSLTVNEISRRAARGVVEITTSDGGSAPFPSGRDGARPSAQGSGFVYDERGYVVTNHHVVAGAASITVTFPNGAEYKARLVGSDPSTDLALLKVDAPASALAPLALGNSDSVEVGDGVVAIGSPFGLEGTVTSGIVSALHRQITAPNGFAIDDAIQTDAAINHGNSGGPLLDLEGKVIGVSAQIESESGGNDGIGFAIPSNTVRKVVAQLLADGKVEHPYLGVGIDDAPEGASVTQVAPGTPAARAGLRAGDVITHLDGTRVPGADELRARIGAKKPGDRVELRILRGGEARTVTATLGVRPS